MAELSTNPEPTASPSMQFTTPFVSAAELWSAIERVGLSANTLVRAAIEQAWRSHEHQTRDGGGRTLEQHIYPVTVSVIERAERYGKPVTAELVAAALTHDVPEDDPLMPMDQFRAKFRPLAMHSSNGSIDMVETVVTLTEPDWRGFAGETEREKKLAQAEAYSRAVTAGSDDAIFIKVCDREKNILCSHLIADPQEILDYCVDTERWILPLARERCPDAADSMEERIKALRRFVSESQCS